MLTDEALKALRPREKPYKVGDAKGLYVIVRPDGAPWWRLKYRWQGKEKLLSLGAYPDTSLKLARENRDPARAELATGCNPSATRKAEKSSEADTFEVAAREWLAKQRSLKGTTVEQLRHRFEAYAFPHIGGSPVRSLTFADVLAMLRRIEVRGKHETAHRVRSLGYTSEQQTGHGFRTIASTLLHELGYTSDVIELQLAHNEDRACQQLSSASAASPPTRSATS